MSSLPPPARHALLYDDDCGFCKWMIARTLAYDRAGHLRPVAIRSPEGERLLAGLSPEERLESWHVVTADGRRHSGGAAFAPVLRVRRGGRPVARLLARWPALADRGYRAVASRRGFFGRRLGRGAVAAAEARIAERGGPEC